MDRKKYRREFSQKRKKDCPVLSKEKYEAKHGRFDVTKTRERKIIVKMPSWTNTYPEHNITSQCRITRKLGIFTNGKKSAVVDRSVAVVLTEEMKARADEDLMQIISLANRDEAEKTTRNIPVKQLDQTPNSFVVSAIVSERRSSRSLSSHQSLQTPCAERQIPKVATPLTLKSVASRLHKSLERKCLGLFPSPLGLDRLLKNNLQNAYNKREIKQTSEQANFFQEKETVVLDQKDDEVMGKSSSPAFRFQPLVLPSSSKESADNIFHQRKMFDDVARVNPVEMWEPFVQSQEQKREELGWFDNPSPDSWRSFGDLSFSPPSPLLSPETRTWTIPARPMF